MKNTIEEKILISIIILFLSQAVVSCKSNSVDDDVESGSASVKITFFGADYEKENIDIVASARKGNNIAPESEQVQFIPLEESDNYVLKAKLVPDNSSNQIKSKAQILSKLNPLASVETVTLKSGIKYKLIIYDANGKYVQEQECTSGQGGFQIDKLNGGGTYTFVVYSTGSNTYLPSVSYIDPSKKTLDTATLKDVSGENDLMFFSKTLTLTGVYMNYLDIVLKHKFSQIVATLNALPTLNYTIYKVSDVTISPHSEKVNMQLSNGNIANTGLAVNRTLSFPSTDSKIITSAPVVINSDNTTSGIFTIGSVTLKFYDPLQITHQNIKLNNLKISRGVKYNLKLSFIPNDKYLTYRGYPAVRINGVIFMRHNLGANYSSNPDSPSQDIVGNYYQWGKNKVVATGATGNGAIPGWDATNNSTTNAWMPNKNEEMPNKSVSNDPCPSGWRVMAPRDINAIRASSNYSYSGNLESSKPGLAIGILTSRFNSVIKITFPFGGFREFDNGRFSSTNYTEGVYWQSVDYGSDSDLKPEFLVMSKERARGFFTNQSSVSRRGMSVRCVAEYPY
ncbi:hypothetical protein CMU01_00550 [Elizabethkingia anophelis]|nr:hypothetical protein [Elizabethkingia anophelis]